jgi:hypothetical protein
MNYFFHIPSISTLGNNSIIQPESVVKQSKNEPRCYLFLVINSNIHVFLKSKHVTRFEDICYFMSSVGIAMGYGLDGWGSIPGRGKNFIFSIMSRPALGPTQPPIQWVPGVISLVVKRQGR